MAICYCGKSALFNYDGETRGILCALHKEHSMVDVMHKTCESKDCKVRPTYNNYGEKNGRFCNKHKEPHMINVTHIRCEFNGCMTRPQYNSIGETKGRFCSKHKKSDMIDVLKKTCEQDGCDIIPVYNIDGEKKGRFCLNHKEPNMINIVNRICEANGCNIQPSYNILGKKKGRFCYIHKEPNMIDVINKSCEIYECNKMAMYNISGESRARFCINHKESNMIDVKHTKCEIENCNTRPSYNIIGKTQGRFCFEHKESNMINVISRLCEFIECKKHSTYNFNGESKGRFCAEHKLKDMVNVISKLCEITNCGKRANFGWLSKGAVTCATHKQNGMIYNPNRRCITIKCKELGAYEANGCRYCEKHMPENSKNLGINTCTVCGLDDILTNGICVTCDPSTIHTLVHTKENRVKNILQKMQIDCIHDKILEDKSCGGERPDFQIDCGTHFVYIEVDENQHKSYLCECEQIRMINMIEVRGIPVRWIRYNPDSYKPVQGQRVITLENREKKLEELIRYAIKHSPIEDGAFSNVLYLFYDEYDISNYTWYKLK
jgi:hypothetical protein